MNRPSPAGQFALYFGRLLSQLVHQPEDLDAQRVAVRQLLALNEDRVTLTWDNWRLRVGEDVLEPTNAGVLELVSRMAAHGIRELSFTPGTDRAHLVGVVGTLAQDPVIGDGGANLIARLGMLGADTVRVTPVVDPEKLPDILGLVLEIEAPAPAPAEAPKPEPVSAPPQTKVIHAVRPQPAAAPAPVPAPPPVAQAATPAPSPPVSAAPDAPLFDGKETVEVLLDRLNTASPSDVKTITRALDGLAAYTEKPAKRLGETATILLGLMAAEPKLTDPEAKRMYGYALTRIAKPTLFRGLAGDLARSPEKRGDYMRIFRYFGEISADHLIEELAHAESAKERKVLFTTIAELRMGISTLIALLGDERWYVVRNAADLLGEMKATEAQSGLVWLLSHGESRVRKSAANALGKIGTPTARSALKEAMKHQSPDVRANATLAFANPSQRDSLPPIIRALTEEEHPDVQRALLAALGKIGTPEAIQHLLSAAEPEKGFFKKKPTPLRVAAITALADTNAPAAKPALLELAKDKDKDIREAATRAMTPAKGVPLVWDVVSEW